MDYCITFGQQYRHTRHPASVRNVIPHPDGWMVIEAESYEDARDTARAVFGDTFTGIYPADEFSPEWYPRGELGRIKA